MSQKALLIEATKYVEQLSRSIAENAMPYFADSLARLNGESSRINKFPNHPGVYVIMRKVLPKDGYRYKGIETIESPLILYVGKTTAKRSIKARLVDHFGGLKPNYQSSQFRKFIYQVCQDDEAVKNIVWSENTLIATVSIEEPDEVIDCVEKLAMQVFRPRFNIKDR
jgi:hypothetical protein